MYRGGQFLVAVIAGACVSRLFVPERSGAVGIMLDALFAGAILGVFALARALLTRRKRSATRESAAGNGMKVD
jgi:hypothetical protein